MSLLREIQTAATDGNVDVAIVLRKAKVLAARLGNRDFEEWVNRELNGYNNVDLPAYRIIPVAVRAHLKFGYQHWNEAPVMTKYLPEKLRDWGKACYIRQPIAELTSMSNGDKEFKVDWPQEMAVKFGAKGYNGAECLGAWQIFSSNVLVGVIDTVRTRILEFALQLERENPEVGEAPANTRPVAPERIQPLVQNIIYGNVGNIAQNSEHFSQSATIGITPQELAKLVSDFTSHIDELNLDAVQKQRLEAQLAALRAELNGDPDLTVIKQAGHTIRNLTEGIIAGVIATAIQPTIWIGIQNLLSNF